MPGHWLAKWGGQWCLPTKRQAKREAEVSLSLFPFSFILPFGCLWDSHRTGLQAVGYLGLQFRRETELESPMRESSQRDMMQVKKQTGLCSENAWKRKPEFGILKKASIERTR